MWFWLQVDPAPLIGTYSPARAPVAPNDTDVVSAASRATSSAVARRQADVVTARVSIG